MTTKTWTLATVLEEGRRLRNWGRWGADDEIGTLNFITPEKVKEAAALVRKGKIISTALNESMPRSSSRSAMLRSRLSGGTRLAIIATVSAATSSIARLCFCCLAEPPGQRRGCANVFDITLVAHST